VTRRQLALIAVLGTTAAAGGLAAVTAGGDPAPVPLVSVGRLVEAYAAGTPPEGLIELRATAPGTGETYAVLWHAWQDRRDPEDRRTCNIPAPERELRTYPVRDPGLCMPHPIPEGSPFPVLTNGGGSVGRPFVLSGTVMPEVERLTVDGPGGRHAVPISPHRSFLLVYAPTARGTATLTAELADGTTGFHVTSVGARTAPPPPSG